MLNKTFCTEKIIDFIETTEQYLSGCLEINDVKTSFLNNISDNEENLKVFLIKLDVIKTKLHGDLLFFLESDPAIDNEDEVIFAYPGYKAIVYYRVAHALNNMDFKFISRVISEHAHFLTGIDIHPEAKIGCPFFIDHGTGIVIGQTAIVGDYVKIYQGVTLGALSLGKGHLLKGTKRHPTVGNHVTLYSGASILGDITIGNNVVIGSNVFLTDSIGDNYKVVLSKPELILIKK